MTLEELKNSIIFPVGDENVTFEPSCRNNWHIHHSDNGEDQILLVTAG